MGAGTRIGLLLRECHLLPYSPGGASGTTTLYRATTGNYTSRLRISDPRSTLLFNNNNNMLFFGAFGGKFVTRPRRRLALSLTD